MLTETHINSKYSRIEHPDCNRDGQRFESFRAHILSSQFLVSFFICGYSYFHVYDKRSDILMLTETHINSKLSRIEHPDCNRDGQRLESFHAQR